MAAPTLGRRLDFWRGFASDILCSDGHMTDEGVTLGSVSARPFPGLSSGIVRVIDGPDRGRRCGIANKPVVIGTLDECDLKLRDPKVSRRHCEVTLDAQGFLVRDLGSRNGTRFEGSLVREVFVPPGALLRVGGTHLTLTVAHDTNALEPSSRTAFGELVGSSLGMRSVFALLERAAACDATVLLGGETGTGKELAARAVHLEGPRARAPYEVFDCGAVAPGLLASELFGHVRGAFSGADVDRAGVFERADGGTVFLDEIGELPPSLQPALLRVCDRTVITRVGDARPRKIDVRLIAATRRDLAADVVAGRFREDLYYRLQILPVVLPPLRDRREDLPALCTHLLRELGCRDPGPITGPGLAVLAQHAWPGNVRELKNTLERALSRAGGPRPFRQLSIEPDEMRIVTPAESDATGTSFHEQRDELTARFEREFLSNLMRQESGNVRSVSRISGIERTQLRRLLRRHGLT